MIRTHKEWLENKPNQPVVLFETEGTYPFVGGGVSTWSHILCQELNGSCDFILYAITGDPNVESRYKLGKNIQGTIHVPLWGAEEPAEYFDPETPFSEQVNRKMSTTWSVIEKSFCPMFYDLLDALADPFLPAETIGEIVYGLWKFFRHYDYKMTLTHPMIWEIYKTRVSQDYSQYLKKTGFEVPNIFDMIFGLRWFYHFMMPLAVPVPPSSVSHATLAGFAGIPSLIAKYEYGTPMIVTDHGVFIRERLIAVSQAEFTFFAKKFLVDMSTLMTRAVYAHADQISPVASYNRRWEMKFDATEDRISVIYNGIDPNVFVPKPKPESTAKRPTVVAAARVFPLKDIETMIRTCDLVRKEIPDVHFLVYGSLDADKPYVETCRKLIEELKVEKNFTFGGFHSNPPGIYNEGDISILTSISEGFPYTVIESMSCARPVVATDVGGTREALEDCGIICKPRDPVSLSEGVISLLRDDDLRYEMGKRGREKVLLNFTTEVSVDAYKSSYQKFHKVDGKPMKQGVKLPSVRKFLESLGEIGETDAA